MLVDDRTVETPSEHALPALQTDAVYQALGTTPQGLTQVEAQTRLAAVGPNALREVKGKPLWQKFLANFTHLMALLLWVGGIVGFIAQLPQLGVAIWLVNLINGLFSFWQEFKAERATEALQRLLAPTARVCRDNQEQRIPAEQVVPGDILLLSEGDRIAADARLVQAAELRVDQSTLTGEAMPVRKMNDAILRTDLSPAETPNLVFAGTAVASGTGQAVVYATGMATEFGKIAHLTQTVGDQPSPLQIEMDRATRAVTFIAVGIGALFFLLAVFVARITLVESFIFAMGMIVAFVPEGMLPTVTLALAMGVQHMAGRHALIKRLSAVETLGSATVICTDKTGTLTQNEMTAREVWVAGRRYSVTGVGYAPEGEVRLAADQHAQAGPHPRPATEPHPRPLPLKGEGGQIGAAEPRPLPQPLPLEGEGGQIGAAEPRPLPRPLPLEGEGGQTGAAEPRPLPQPLPLEGEGGQIGAAEPRPLPQPLPLEGEGGQTGAAEPRPLPRPLSLEGEGGQIEAAEPRPLPQPLPLEGEGGQTGAAEPRPLPQPLSLEAEGGQIGAAEPRPLPQPLPLQGEEGWMDPDLRRTLVVAALCNNARVLPPNGENPRWSVLGDPTEAALRVLAAKAGLDLDVEAQRTPRVRELPFESRRKRMSTVHVEDRRRTTDDRQPMTVGGPSSVVAFVKGAPKEVLALCTRIRQDGRVVTLNDAMRAQIVAANDEYARNGLRVLAMAERPIEDDSRARTAEEVEQDLTFLGLVAMMDPPRPEVAAAVERCHHAGIRIIMITGDYGLTAESIARRIGIIRGERPRIVTGVELEEMDEGALEDALQEEVIFARVAPEHKLRVVQALQARGQIVAVTGDGVNDAPALKRANIGVAMGITGTDVAKEAADMILTDDNFASIVNAIEEGRTVYANIKKFISYIFTSNTAEAVPFILFVLSAGRVPLALNVMQVLSIDLGTDMLPALALGAEPPEPGVMDRPPRDIHEHIISRRLLTRSLIFLGLVESAVSMIAFYWLYWTNGYWGQWLDLPGSGTLYLAATALALAGVVFAQIGNLFTHRTDTQPFWKVGLFANRLIWVGIATELLIVAALIYLPPLQAVFETAPFPPIYWLFLLAWVPALPIADEARKWARRRR